ncbi:MAG: hypothetical protein ACJAS4_001173 [Bacteriovoracaceae bacterium]|jgi:hypothetical protein
MKAKKPKIICLMILFVTVLSSPLGHAKYPTSEDLRTKYPNIEEDAQRPEKKEILCPFWRLIERSGTLDAINTSKNSDVVISIRKLVAKATEFGCKWIECGAVATLVSGGQMTHPGTTRLFSVNISQLHKAKGVAHECGFTFEKGGKKVSNAKRTQTLSRLKKIADKNSASGTLSKEDLMSVKLQICKEQGVIITKAGSVEVGLIYSFLGGKDRGFIEYDDVVRFFHAQMPLTKSIDKI